MVLYRIMQWPPDVLEQIKRLPESVKWVVGIDEVGRGSIAGPMVLGLCVVQQGYERGLEQIENLDDSKKLTPKKRQKILQAAKQVNISIILKNYRIGPVKIDKQGIRQCYLELLKRVIKQFPPDETIYLLDYGIPIHAEFKYYQSLKKGDAIIPAIALASISAEESRDIYMKTTAHAKFPEYGFDTHVGYGTKSHKAQIKKHGDCEQHRKSWIK